MSRILIAAVGDGDVIGLNGDLPWKRIPKDMQFFKTQTTGHIVVMGRKTWDSIPPKYRPLEDRVNVVVTRNTSFNPGSADVEVITGLDEARLQQLENKYPGKDIYIIGGGDIYKTAIDNRLIDRAIITRVNYSIPINELNDTVACLSMRNLKRHLRIQSMFLLTNTPYVCYVESYGQPPQIPEIATANTEAA